MKILVTGANGQLGYDVMSELISRGVEAIPACRDTFDITVSDSVDSYITSVRPDAVIHCAAFTAVDKAENEKELCAAVNISGTKNIANACNKCGSKLIYISSDYVYGSDGDEPLEPDSPKSPVNYYGVTKLLGEESASLCQKLFIVRTSWVFGINGKNFVKTMIYLGSEKESINVVNDQIGSPTYTKDLARLLCDMAFTEKYGIYNASNEGCCSWAEFAEEILTLAKSSAKINPISSAEYNSPVRRPRNSRLSKKCLTDAGFELLPSWYDAVRRFITYELKL